MIDPGPPTGDSVFSAWLGRFRRFVLSCRLISGAGYRVKYHERGTELIIPAVRGGGEGGGGMNWRGEWSLTGNYSLHDVVRVSAGLNAGTYIAVVDAPGHDNPWEGENWALLGKITNDSTWL